MGTPVVFVPPPDAASRYTGYLHLAWPLAAAPWEDPRPRVDPAFVEAMTLPLRLALRQFMAM